MRLAEIQGETSVIKLKVKEQVPKLHYVHPTCFEAGKPIELVACGSNLIQPELRFLVSFAGKYLTDVCVSPLCNKTDSATNFGHQLLNICIPHTALDVFGPGFIEVENESGLSNFIPIIIADKESFSEIKRMQVRFHVTTHSGDSQSTAASISCDVAVLRQNKFSDLLLDMAWLLKEPTLEDMGYAMTSLHLKRFTCILNFLTEYNSTTVLARVLRCMKIRINGSLHTGIVEADRTLFQGIMTQATEVLRHRLEHRANLVWHSRDLVLKANDQSSRDGELSVIPAANQDMGLAQSRLGALKVATSAYENEAVPLLNEECVMTVTSCKEHLEKSSNLVFHPQKATTIATTIRMRLF